MIPFDAVIPPEARDPDLAEKLRAEYPQILQWMIDGCIAWQAAGLNPPERVRVATQDYLESADAFGRWLEERCIRAPNETATKGEVFASWKAWAEANGEFVGSQRRLNDKLAAVPGLDEGRLGHGGRKAWLGLGLLSEA